MTAPTAGRGIGRPAARRVLVLAPMRSELRPLARRLGAVATTVGDLTLHTGRVGDAEVVAAQAGVGPATAAATTERILSALAVDQVVVSGVAGGLAPWCEVGVVVVPEVVVDLSSGRELVPDPLGRTVRKGRIGTTDELILDPVRLGALLEQGVAALDMESTGIAGVCRRRGLPWSVLRVISDRPDHGLTEPAVLGALRPDGSTDPVGAARLIARRPWRLPGLVRLGRDAGAAASLAAEATLRALGSDPGR